MSDPHAVLAGNRAPLERKLFDYANSQRKRTYADLFIANHFQLAKDENGRPTAHMMGDARSVEIEDDGSVAVPIVAMVFGLPQR